MSLKDRMYELTAVEEVDEFMEKFPTGAFFKAGGCHKTMQGFGYVEQALNPRENIHVGFVRVIECRPVSNYIAEITQVIHQSPQLILYIDRKPVYDVDNWNITLPALETAFTQFFGPAVSKEVVVDATTFPSAANYIELLKKFIYDKISLPEFRKQWLLTFQMDATPRPTEQFELLNTLFGNVDEALLQPDSFGQTSHENAPIKERAKNLLQTLTHV